jgi:hypothetical protein
MCNGMQRRDFIRSTGLVAEAAAAASLMKAPALAQTSPTAGLKPITYDIRPMSFDPNASAITALIEEAGSSGASPPSRMGERYVSSRPRPALPRRRERGRYLRVSMHG